jgi:hypothetical protein
VRWPVLSFWLRVFEAEGRVRLSNPFLKKALEVDPVGTCRASEVVRLAEPGPDFTGLKDESWNLLRQI